MVDIRGGILLVSEQAVGVVDGSNAIFQTTKKYISGTLRVELNGVRMVIDDDYIEVDDQTFTMSVAPENTLGYSDKVSVEYERK